MWQSAWDKVWGLYDLCIGIPSFIIDDAIVDQWSPTASSAGSQRWTGSDDPDTLYPHVVLLSLTLLNLLNPPQGREQGNYGGSPKQFVYSAVVIFVHPSQILSTIQNAMGFFKQQYNAILQGGHSNSWCILCKLPHYETSRYFPMIPQMPYLALPMLESTADPTVWPQLCLDTASCDADHMTVWLLHHMQCYDMDYAMMPPALQSTLEVPWDLHMEEYLKLWQNSTYITWKAGFPSEEVGIAMTFISTNHREFNTHRLVIDISDGMAIHYPVLKVDDDDGEGDESLDDAADDNGNNDYTKDEDDLDEDLQRTVMEVANKTDDSGFCSSAEDNPKIEVLTGSETTWTGKAPSYSLRATVVSYSAWSSSQTASHSKEVSGASFDAYVNVNADGSGTAELMRGQALLRDHTTAAELKQLCELANEQIQIARHFDAKFSNTQFTLL